MFLINQIKIKTNNFDEVKMLPYIKHTDYDLVEAEVCSLYSETGKMHDVYRTHSPEIPDRFRSTPALLLCKKIDIILKTLNLDTTRIRINKLPPYSKIPMHLDDDNRFVKTLSDLHLRIIIALNEDSNFIYQFKYNNELIEKSLKLGENVIFEPDSVYHGCINNSNQSRYALVIVAKATSKLKTVIKEGIEINV